jgi:hypothetical protein
MLDQIEGALPPAQYTGKSIAAIAPLSRTGPSETSRPRRGP